MSSTNNASPIQQKLQQLPLVILCKSIAIPGLILFIFYALLFSHPDKRPSDFISFSLIKSSGCSNTATDSPTNLSHVGFVVIGSLNSWKHRRAYTESWWRSNVTRGYVFLDKEPTQEFLPWPSTSPPYQINYDITKLRVYPKVVNPIQVRMVHSVLDMYRVGDKDLRWFVMCDDDTLLLVDNLVEVLQKYDHTKYVYIGGISESVKSNADFSFDMGFGGAGYILSYPLAEALSKTLEDCLERYPYLFVSDQMAQSCLADIGVALNIEKGIHQVDLHNDISGFLSSHPQSPLLSLHHFDVIYPLFPSKDRYESVGHLMKAANFDQSRMLQQTICYRRESNWSFSVSWGYSTHVYESIIPRSILRKPLETFRPWERKAKPPFFMFNTRWLYNNPCEAPHVFFFESVEYTSNNQLLTTYVRTSPRNLPPCSATGNHSADPISRIQVFSPAKTRKKAGGIECCDVKHKAETNVTEISIRSCAKNEVIA
ncbi:hypothetical protein K2173_022108 [Erythroxylum novogranatense]|uniref:Uncharacterized protein n=1 Tax=Erythroxylum novogranatense TaxID=1862640 RepID=A0AAV8TVC9_9ROSI|nr:hypothetical protein K2173_022108 [Erythroxylum novogranatense]